MLNLHHEAIEDLMSGSGLTEEMISAAGIRDIRPHDLVKLGPQYRDVHYAYSLSYGGIDGTFIDFQRLKLFPPVANNRHPIKYWQAPNTQPHLYLPPGVDWEVVAANPACDLILCEGEKKGLVGAQLGLTAAAIGGEKSTERSPCG